MPLPHQPIPDAVRTSHMLWLGAIATALVELLTRLLCAPEGFANAVSQGWSEITVRFMAYALLLTLSLLMLRGRSLARWALTAIFGGLGTFSLIAEPIGWLMDGGAVSSFLAAADAATWVMIVSRVAHIACVWGGVIMMFQPAANAYFRASA